MDISGVMTPSSQAGKHGASDSIGSAVHDKAVESEAQTAEELISSVVHKPQEIPAEKLPPHMGRNLNVTA